MRQPLAIVVATAAERVIGLDGGMPWHLPEDLKHFKRVTMGHTIIMGRRTFESIGKALPGRRTIVVTRNEKASFRRCDVAHSLGQAIEMAREGGDEEPMVVGGATLYEEALPMATRLHLTEIDLETQGDTFFPAWDDGSWTERSSRRGNDERLLFRELVRP